MPTFEPLTAEQLKVHRTGEVHVRSAAARRTKLGVWQTCERCGKTDLTPRSQQQVVGHHFCSRACRISRVTTVDDGLRHVHRIQGWLEVLARDGWDRARDGEVQLALGRLRETIDRYASSGSAPHPV